MPPGNGGCGILVVSLAVGNKILSSGHLHWQQYRLALRWKFQIGYKTRHKAIKIDIDCGWGVFDCGIVSGNAISKSSAMIASTLRSPSASEEEIDAVDDASFVICDCGSGDCVAINIGDGQNNSTSVSNIHMPYLHNRDTWYAEPGFRNHHRHLIYRRLILR
ncbi:hypothetical protein O9992_20345 [Vibrio lentus]|nr:hypothetical protein [Vibrio lentus]